MEEISLRDKIITDRDRKRITIVDNDNDIKAYVDKTHVYTVFYIGKRMKVYHPLKTGDGTWNRLRKLAISQVIDMAEEKRREQT